MFLWPKVGPYTLIFSQPEDAEAVRSSFAALEQYFVMYDADKSLQLSHDEITKMLQEQMPDALPTLDDAMKAVLPPGQHSLSFGRFLLTLYLLCCPDGAYVKNLPTPGSAPQKAEKENLKDLLVRAFKSLEEDFGRMDVDGSCVIELSEMTKAIGAMMPGRSKIDIISRIEHYFHEVDLDGSGAIDFYEYLFFVYLLTQDGSYKEVLDAATDAATVKKAFMVLRSSYSKYDADHSKRLSIDETETFLRDSFPDANLGDWKALFARLQSAPDRPHIDFVRFMRLLYEILVPDAKYASKNADKAGRPVAARVDGKAGAVAAGPLPYFDDVAVGEVQKEKKLGQGGAGAVYKALYRGHIVAAKFLLGNITQDVGGGGGGLMRKGRERDDMGVRLNEEIKTSQRRAAAGGALRAAGRVHSARVLRERVAV
jgi:Ca2+-binding EF-hand superfamily protein